MGTEKRYRSHPSIGVFPATLCTFHDDESLVAIDHALEAKEAGASPPHCRTVGEAGHPISAMLRKEYRIHFKIPNLIEPALYIFLFRHQVEDAEKKPDRSRAQYRF